MRVLSLLLLCLSPCLGLAAVATSGQSIVIAGYELVKPLNAELVESNETESVAAHLIVLGALEKVNRVLEPEQSTFVTGTKKSYTFFLPDARRTAPVGEYYEEQLARIGEIRFQCAGRTCGSSSYWANKIFNEKILYGPEQFQRYYIAELTAQTGSDVQQEPAERAFVSVYVGQRATGKIYVHIVHIHP